MTQEVTQHTYMCPFCQAEVSTPSLGTALSCSTCDIAIAAAPNAQRATALALAHLVDSEQLIPPAPVEVKISTLPSGAIVAAWNPETLLSLSRAAAILGLRPRTLRQHAHEGKLETVRPGTRHRKVTRDTLLTFLRELGQSRQSPYLREGTPVRYRGAPYRILRRTSTPTGTRFDLEPTQGGPPALNVPASDFALGCSQRSSDRTR